MSNTYSSSHSSSIPASLMKGNGGYSEGSTQEGHSPHYLDGAMKAVPKPQLQLARCGAGCVLGVPDSEECVRCRQWRREWAPWLVVVMGGGGGDTQ